MQAEDLAREIGALMRRSDISPAEAALALLLTLDSRSGSNRRAPWRSEACLDHLHDGFICERGLSMGLDRLLRAPGSPLVIPPFTGRYRARSRMLSALGSATAPSRDSSPPRLQDVAEKLAPRPALTIFTTTGSRLRYFEAREKTEMEG